MKAFALIAAGAAAAGGLWFYVSSQRTAALRSDISDGLMVCAQDPSAGAAKLGAIRRLYGDDAIPRDIIGDVLICETRGLTSDANDLAARARALNGN